MRNLNDSPRVLLNVNTFEASLIKFKHIHFISSKFSRKSDKFSLNIRDVSN